MHNKFIWSEEYSVGIPEMDSQHQRFFNITNSIFEYIEEDKKDFPALQVLINYLIGYSIYHLYFEEGHFEKFKYEDRYAHIEGHDAFRGKIQRFKNELNDSNVDLKDLALRVSEFASEWLQQHIKVVDKKYTEYFKRHPLETHDEYELTN